MKTKHFIKPIYLYIVIISLLLTGCFTQPRTPYTQQKIKAPAVTADSRLCGDWQVLEINDFKLENNVWNKQGISDYKQCVYKIDFDSPFPFGWTWAWPEKDSSVKAYPEIIYGWKPWATESTNTNIPVQISSINELVVSYDINTEAEGNYNLSFDIWINKQKTPSPNNISAELMIWLHNHGMYPAGGFVEQVTIDGELYDFNIGGVGHAGWVYIAFVIAEPEYKGDTKIHEFLKYLVDNDHISSSEYISSIELGNELIDGIGNTRFDHFSVMMK